MSPTVMCDRTINFSINPVNVCCISDITLMLDAAPVVTKIH